MLLTLLVVNLNHHLHLTKTFALIKLAAMINCFKANNLNPNQILMDGLQQLYNFDKTNSTVQKKFWQLEIIDETILQKFESDTSNSTGMSY